MNEILPEEFLLQARRRVFKPDAAFVRRVVEQIKPVARPVGLIWDYVPAFARPIVALMTVFLLALISFHMVFPAPLPAGDVGIVDEYLGADAVPADEWLYRYAEPPEGEDLLIEISVAEGL